MKTILKKVSAVVLAFAVMLTALVFDFPEKITAEAAVSISTPGGCDGNHESMTPWTGGDFAQRGSYYLTDDVTLNEYIDIDFDVTLCLQGHTITIQPEDPDMANCVRIRFSSNFTLCDCKNDAGKLKSYIYVSRGKFTMYGGTIVGSDDELSGVSVKEQSEFNMYGGTISGFINDVSIASDGTFNMYGGTISDCTHSGVDVDGAFNMYDGKITGNEPHGVYLSGSKAIFNMYNGEISNNHEGVSQIDGKFIMSGGSIVNNLFGVWLNNGDFTMSGGTISGNTTTTSSSGSGVYFKNGTFKIDGKVDITGNKKSDGSASNVYLNDNRTITIGSNFSTDSVIGVTTYRAPTSCSIGKNTQVTAASDTNTVNSFVPDDESKIAIYSSKVVYLTAPHEKLEHTAEKLPNCTEKGNVEYWYCAACKKNFSDDKGTTAITETTIAKLGHIYSEWQHDADKHWKECTREGCTMTPSISNHSWNTTVNTEANCTTSGKKTLTCSICEYTKTEDIPVNANAHNYGGWNISITPTISTTGTAEKICNIDPTHTDIIPIPKLTDTDVWEKTVNADPSIDEVGSYTYTSDYGTVIVDDVPMLTDDPWKKTETTKPTKDDDGLYTYTSDYGTVTVDVPKLTGSVWAKNEEKSTPPTEEDDGKDVYTSIYGEVAVTIPQLSHTHVWGDWTITKAPTETKTGTAERTCSKDSEHKDTVTLPVLTNTTVWTNQTDKHVDPTEEIPGKDVYTSEYGEVEVRIPELAHTHELTYVPEVPATETKEGTKEHWHCGGCDKDFADKDGEVEVNGSDLIIPIITTEITVGENAPQVTTDQDELVEAVDIDNVEDSSEIKITLIVEDASETVTESDKLAAEEALTELDGFQMGQFIDISLIMETITGSETITTAITETKKPLTITLAIPSSFLGKAEYSVIRVHEGEITVLEDMDDDPTTVTIKTDKFSTYALAYTEKASGDTPPDESSSDSEATPSGSGGTSDSDTALPGNDNSSNNESGGNSDNSDASGDDNNYKPSENTPTDNNHGNPSTGVAVSLLPLAVAITVLTVTAKRKKK